MKKIAHKGFYIEKRFFPWPKGGLGDSFKIKSSPYDYRVNFMAEKNAFIEVNRRFIGQPRNILLIDKNVYKLYRQNIKIPSNRIFQVQADENFKTLDGAIRVIDFLRKNNFTKADKLIVVGGGVVQDIGAFVCAVFKRGVPWVFFPTTLLAMCDSCIGAKASINYGKVKNQLGVFCAPKEIYINVNFLKTLDARQIKSGLGEIFKLCASGGMGAYNKFLDKAGGGEVKTLRDYTELIKLALSVKKPVIEIDEFDRGFRKSLNYGHTFGHALEVLTDYAVPHGQAVVAGMAIANEISEEKKFLSRGENQKLSLQGQKFFDSEFKAALSRLNPHKFLELLKQDKKANGNVLNIVLLKNLGHLIFSSVKINQSFLSKINKIIKKIF